LVAIVAQASLDRLYKETHQAIDLVALFRPVTKHVGMIYQPEATPEMVRKMFKEAQTERCGATCLVVPEDIAAQPVSGNPLPVNIPVASAPSTDKIKQAKALIEGARCPIILAGHGVCRDQASSALRQFAAKLNIPVATTFLAKGVMSERDPFCLGTLGFMLHDYINFRFDEADLVITVGYDLVEYPPVRWNPRQDKKILHLSRTVAEVDAAYSLSAGIEGSLPLSLQAIAEMTQPHRGPVVLKNIIQNLHREELAQGAKADAFPLKPQRIVADIRAALGDEDIVLCDTGALKMWMARLYPCYEPDTCLISNGLATMAFALPGGIGARLARPNRKILATMGDGSYLMNSQEIETAVREKIPFVVLVWVDQHYGLIKWKMEIELGHSCQISFTNPDFIRHAESLGAKAYQITAASELLPTLHKALAEDCVSVIACPVDYSENAKLVEALHEFKPGSPAQPPE